MKRGCILNIKREIVLALGSGMRKGDWVGDTGNTRIRCEQRKWRKWFKKYENKIECFDFQVIVLIKKQWWVHCCARRHSTWHIVCHCFYVMERNWKIIWKQNVKFTLDWVESSKELLRSPVRWLDDCSLDCTVGLNVQWEDFAEILESDFSSGKFTSCGRVVLNELHKTGENPG